VHSTFFTVHGRCTAHFHGAHCCIRSIKVFTLYSTVHRGNPLCTVRAPCVHRKNSAVHRACTVRFLLHARKLDLQGGCHSLFFTSYPPVGLLYQQKSTQRLSERFERCSCTDFHQHPYPYPYPLPHKQCWVQGKNTDPVPTLLLGVEGVFRLVLSNVVLILVDTVTPKR